MKHIYKALFEFQQHVKPIFTESTGHNYKYASIGQIIEKIKPILGGCGLVFNQRLDEGKIITTIVHYESGEYIESTETIPKIELRGMNPYQSYGSGITYYRRYALATILGLVTDKDADAQGEYDNGIVDPAISPTAFGDDLIKQIHKRITAINKQLGHLGEVPTLEDLIDAGESSAIEEYKIYANDLKETQAKKWIDDQMTKTKKTGSIKALGSLWNEAVKNGFNTQYVIDQMSAKKKELQDASN